MQKELNPELFGERRTLRSSLVDNSPSASVSAAAAAETGGFLNLDKQVLELKNLAVQTQEFMKTSSLKLERLAQQVQRIEQSHNGLALESHKRITTIGQRMAERKTIDQKIQEMVDRHTNTIKSFEVRLQQLHKLLSDKESQVVVATAALNDAKMEIARLKRL